MKNFILKKEGEKRSNTPVSNFIFIYTTDYSVQEIDIMKFKPLLLHFFHPIAPNFSFHVSSSTLQCAKLMQPFDLFFIN